MPENVEQKGSKDRGPPSKAPVRVLGEWRELHENTQKHQTYVYLRNRKNESNDTLMTWTVLLCPENEPYKKGAWVIEFQLSPSFPQEAPKLRFITPIYHPNVDQYSGEVGLRLLDKNVWREAMTLHETIENLLKLIDNPVVNNSDYIFNEDAAREYRSKVEGFNRKAKEFTESKSAHRPPDCCEGRKEPLNIFMFADSPKQKQKKK